ncbi:LOB domain-containing protein 37-like [Dorcoceras hygrometricum]|uniref:LOB domain-containing protein 37-like n=1 Tax=Dorcoceras hygrometricum TaxID=472368 RepID=A0A2Z7CUF3_9LAMI|nr:LOB domain-containing protein 37-like [Dorcoceras hygrometricum]
MSCNGCRILRKGCKENCILRQSLQGIQSPQAQANATVFVAKFFGRAGLMSFLSSVHESQRADLFQSLLFEACGRTVNPVNGALGLQWTGNWHLCQAAVETVLRGGVLRALPEFEEGFAGNEYDMYGFEEMNLRLKRRGLDVNETTSGLNLGFTSGFPARMTAGGRVNRRRGKRPVTPSEESEKTTFESGFVMPQNDNYDGHQTKLLRLFF